MENMLATDEVWSDVKAGDRPTADALEVSLVARIYTLV